MQTHTTALIQNPDNVLIPEEYIVQTETEFIVLPVVGNGQWGDQMVNHSLW